MSAAESLQAGDLDAALSMLQGDVRREPDKVTHRMFLFQLLSVMGQWERALKQLQVIAELDPSGMVLAQLYGEAIRCESVRREVFEGKRAPTFLSEPMRWSALLVEALRVDSEGAYAHAQSLRAEAFEDAPATSGVIDGEPFDWIADADPRLGPTLEAIVHGRYYWIPFQALAQIKIEPPSALRDVVWMPAELTLTNGGELPALVPTRYPGLEDGVSTSVRMAKRTEWIERNGEHHGVGQRMLTTDKADFALMDLRLVQMASATVTEPAERTPADG